jgi:hypothetical protein
MSERSRWVLVVAGGCLLLAAMDAWWVVSHRHGYPLDIDEAGYTTFAVSDYLGLRDGGLHGWWSAVQTQARFAPLLPALTSWTMVIHPSVLAGFFVLIVLAVLLVLVTYAIGEKLAGPRLGALAAFAVATSQGLFGFTREYVFALPTALFLSCAVYALLCSHGLRERRWSIVCGACLGLMLLSRTMAFAFLPGILVAAVLAAGLRGRADWKNRLVNLGLLVLTGSAVAATWYWRNLDSAFEYLTSYGYGTQSQYFGDEHALISWGRIKGVLERMIVFDLLLPMTLLLLAGLVAGGVIVVRHLRDAEDRRAEATRLLAGDPATILVLVLLGFGALLSSRNGGNGFTFPLTVLLPLLAVLVLRGARRALVVSVVTVVAGIGLLNLVASTSLSDDISKARTVPVPLLEKMPWVDGSPNAVDVMRVEVPGASSHFDPRDKGWPELDARLADLLVEPIGPEKTRPLVGMGGLNRALNVNTITLAAVLRHHVGLPMVQLEAEPTDSVRNYLNEIRFSPLGELSALITFSSEEGDFPPAPTQRKVEKAAEMLDFRVFRRFSLPDGRQLRLWVKRA